MYLRNYFAKIACRYYYDIIFSAQMKISGKKKKKNCSIVQRQSIEPIIIFFNW